jgi:hypothetical protein
MSAARDILRRLGRGNDDDDDDDDDAASTEEESAEGDLEDQGKHSLSPFHTPTSEFVPLRHTGCETS